MTTTTDDDDAQEAVHHDHVLRSFRAYRLAHMSANNLRRQSYQALSEKHRQLLPDQPALLNASILPISIHGYLGYD